MLRQRLVKEAGQEARLHVRKNALFFNLLEVVRQQIHYPMPNFSKLTWVHEVLLILECSRWSRTGSFQAEVSSLILGRVREPDDSRADAYDRRRRFQPTVSALNDAGVASN
jgi:hypothetical protein